MRVKFSTLKSPIVFLFKLRLISRFDLKKSRGFEFYSQGFVIPAPWI